MSRGALQGACAGERIGQSRTVAVLEVVVVAAAVRLILPEPEGRVGLRKEGKGKDTWVRVRVPLGQEKGNMVAPTKREYVDVSVLVVQLDMEVPEPVTVKRTSWWG